ncbi:phospholipase DDHD2-like isoform X2 [Pecten maximus]|uniref:phospholipase DDHD2-like isoform X2 n=1 Tax=Pecten maximus TaxID=6579 RepID=UPI0014588796|nr:phospholipase DDHD2-like isoform X2 [Pecten maximus]
MADRNAKDSTPPPLLLMPAGGGLTLNPPDHPNVLMPVIQSEPSLLGSDEEGEADSFVGQSPLQGSNTPSQPSTFNLFQKSGGGGADPFSQVGHNPHPGPTPTSLFGSPAPTTASQAVVQPTIPSTTKPAGQPFNGGPVSQPMFGSSPAPPPAGNQFRKQQGQRLSTYAQMPSGTYAGGQGGANPYSLGQSPSMMPPGPPSNMMSPGQPPYGAPMGGLPPVPPSIQSSVAMSTSSSPYGGPPVAQVNPTVSQTSFTQRSQTSFDMDQSNYSGAQQGGFYQPVRPHWCFSKRVESKLIWYPFTLKDSMAIEEAYKSGAEVVATDGGRYDVFMSTRTRKSVYWQEDPSPVVRSTWFYKREGDNRYVPYEEQIAQRLESEYQNAVTNNAWHKRLEFPGGETVVMHNQNVMVHFQPSSQPDEWGTVQEEGMRPRVVKRGLDDFESIQEGEPSQVDHLVFMVHGIGSFCDVKFRNVVECVDDFRSISLSLQQSHFKSYVDSNRIGRVEFLPVHWHSALHGDATGLDKMLKKITLPSTGKLRNFVNDTLMDILFYTSPTYCQMIADTVGEEMNRLYSLFLSRNPRFQGTVAVAGHSLGSTILFDLLLHQKDPSSPDLQPPTDSAPHQVDASLSTSFTDDTHSTSSQNGLEEEESEMTLEELLAKVGLQDKLEVFHQEQIDMESLSMCSEGDLKDLGLPMGPRKKLQGLIKDEQHRKQRNSERAERKAKEEIERKVREQLEGEMKSQAALSKPSASRSASINVEYIQGVSGTGRPSVAYPQLSFKPSAFIAMGSPIGVFLSARGLDKVGEDFKLPTCSRLFNVFHPFDPVAYRLEPLVSSSAVNIKPVLIPHHKGRKRLHLELKESLTRVGADIKQKIVDSLKSTWNTINDFAKAHRTSETTLGDSLEQQVDSQISSVMHDLSQEEDDKLSVASGAEEEIYMGQMNEGRRIDYVLQERPIESFNDYLFALASHGCYWESEDTVLLVIRELYGPLGILPEMPDSSGKRLYTGPPPMGPPRGIQQVPAMPQHSVGGPSSQFSPQVPLMSQQTSVPLMSPPSGPPASQGPPMGMAPPLQGFVRSGPK